jgi:hypothetical protein
MRYGCCREAVLAFWFWWINKYELKKTDDCTDVEMNELLPNALSAYKYHPAVPKFLTQSHHAMSLYEVVDEDCVVVTWPDDFFDKCDADAVEILLLP